MVEQRTENSCVAGSSPAVATKQCLYSLMVELRAYTSAYGARLAHGLGSNPSAGTIHAPLDKLEKSLLSKGRVYLGSTPRGGTSI